MELPFGEQWDSYLLGAQISHRKAKEKHLDTCTYCSFLLARRQKELQDLVRVWESSSQPKVIYLAPMEIGDDKETPATILLAAQGNDDMSKDRAITLTSPDQTLLLRAVCDTHTGEMWLYLISDDPDVFRNMLVKPFGAGHEYLTDDQGRVNLGLINWPGRSRRPPRSVCP